MSNNHQQWSHHASSSYQKEEQNYCKLSIKLASPIKFNWHLQSWCSDMVIRGESFAVVLWFPRIAWLLDPPRLNGEIYHVGFHSAQKVFIQKWKIYVFWFYRPMIYTIITRSYIFLFSDQCLRFLGQHVMTAFLKCALLYVYDLLL